MAIVLGQRIATLGSGWVRWTTTGQYNNPIKDGWIWARVDSDGTTRVGVVDGTSPQRNLLSLYKFYACPTPT